MPNLTKRIVDASAPAEREYFVWCSGTPGFGLRVHPTGKKVFVVQVRVGRQTRRMRIGPFGPFTVDQARTQAQEVIRKASLGTDPQREKREARAAITVGELCDAYMEAARAGLVLTRFRVQKRASTVAIDEGRVSRHIKPLIGSTLAQDLTRADVQRMVDQVTQGKTRGIHKTKRYGKAVVKGGGGTAARVASLLGGIYSWGEKRGLVSGLNPVRGVETARYAPRDRVCSTSELRALGKGLEENAAELPDAVAALHLIALTGLRREEAVGLRWSEVDIAGHCLRLSATKTGKSVRPVGSVVVTLLQGLKRTSDVWIFPNETAADATRKVQVGAGSADLKKKIASLFNLAGLNDARSHDLRRTFASAAADEGYSDATIAALLGHSQRNITARHYIRRPDEALIAAADRTSRRSQSDLDGDSAEILRFGRAP
ncbi:MAG: site-specific integrase [Alphaproteobacteria bacterium]|nr:site-specific integrase [Alphaproteobacteria bacterium]